MNSRLLPALLAVSMLAGVGLRSALAQTEAPSQPVANHDQTTDLQAIRLRLNQQDEELRQLRERLGLLQGDVRSLPPVTPASPQSLPSGDVIPASATTNSGLFELQDRMTSLEKRLDEQANQQKVQADNAAKGYDWQGLFLAAARRPIAAPEGRHVAAEYSASQQLEKLQKEFGGFRVALSFLSEAATIFDPQRLKLIVTE